MFTFIISNKSNTNQNQMTKQTVNYSRREFTKLSAMGIASIPLLACQNGLITKETTSPERLNVHLF